MHKAFAIAATLAAMVGLAGCGGSSTKAARNCFDVWNGSSNRAQQARVAHRFPSASVTNWMAQASGGSIDESWTASSSTDRASAGANLSGRANHGCGYLFHTSRQFVSFSAELEGRTVRWNLQRPISGSWSRRQQAVARDNATVVGEGLLEPAPQG
jgi:hypothetical protein